MINNVSTSKLGNIVFHIKRVVPVLTVETATAAIQCDIAGELKSLKYHITVKL